MSRHRLFECMRINAKDKFNVLLARRVCFDEGSGMERQRQGRRGRQNSGRGEEKGGGGGGASEETLIRACVRACVRACK